MENERRNFLRENAVPILLAVTTIVSSYAMVQQATQDNTRRIGNLEKYTRTTQSQVRDNKEDIAVMKTKIDQQALMATELNKTLKGVQDALNKNTVTVELLSAKLRVVKE